MKPERFSESCDPQAGENRRCVDADFVKRRHDATGEKNVPDHRLDENDNGRI
jgi:hypothetical protein